MPYHGEWWKDDLELVTHILQGSTEHFEMLYEAYFPRVYRFALKRLRDPAEAEDVTQEVFFTVYKALPGFQGNSSLMVWIFDITRNTVNRRFRRARPLLESLDADDVREIPTGEAPTDRAVDARRVLSQSETVIESQITPLKRQIFHLKQLRRQSIRAIVRTLGKFEDWLRDPIGIDPSGALPTEPDVKEKEHVPHGGEPWEADQELVAPGGEPWESDQELVAHILRGSIEHCDMLYEAYFPRVYRFALKRLQDSADAEDATKEVFSRVFNVLPRFDGRPSLLAGISHITRNTVNRRLWRCTTARPSRMPGLNREFYRNMAVWLVILAIIQLVLMIFRPE